MTPEEWAAQAAIAKSEYESETQRLDEIIRLTRKKLERLQGKRAAIDDIYKAKIVNLGVSLLGIPEQSLAPVVSVAPGPRRSPGLRKRGILDEPLLNLAREIAAPDVISKQLEDAWNQRHPERPIRDSTVRSILQRLVEDGVMRVSEPGGGKGSGRPTKYQPV